MSNLKKYSLLILIAMLIFILIPVSFANDFDSNATEIGVNEDSNNLSEVDESHFVVENTNYVIDEGEDVEINGDVCLFTDVNYPDPLNIRYEYDDAYGVRQSDIVQYHEDYYSDSFKIIIKNLTYKENPYVITISAVEDDLYDDYLDYGDPLKPVNVTVIVESPYDPQPTIPAYETFTPKGQIYVSAQEGNDSFNGTQDAPFLTIQRALDENKLLGGNYEIIVLSGNYSFDEFYTIQNNVSINGRGKVKITNDGAYYIFFLQGQITVEFKNLIMAEGQSGAISSAATVNGLWEYSNENKVLNIINCTFKDNVGGLGTDHVAAGVIKSYSKTTIINSTFIDNEGLGSQDDFKGLINLPDGSLTMSYCSFINNNVRQGTPLVYTAKRSHADFNFWGTNEGPKSTDVSENVKVKTWVGYLVEIEEGEKLVGDNYTVNVVAKYANSTGIFKDLDVSMPDLSVSLKTRLNSTSKNLIVSNNRASSIYAPDCVGEERIGLYLGNVELSYVEFYVNPAIDKRIFVSTTGNDSNNGTYENPFKTIEAALNKNGEVGGGRTIYILSGTYTENNLAINDKVNLIGVDAIINGEGNQILIIGNDTQIKGLKFINGGIYHSNGTFDIRDSTFEENDVAITSKCMFTVANSTFIKNNKAISADICEIDNCTFENNTEGVYVLKSGNMTNSRFIDNEVAITIIESGIVENNNFTLNIISIKITNSISTSIIGNTFNQDNSPIIASNSILKVFSNEFNGNFNYALDVNSSDVDMKNNVIEGFKTINILNSTLTNAVITYLDNKTVKVKNGTIQLNATVTDDMGNVINGSKIFFGTDSSDVIDGFAYIYKEYDTGDYIISGGSDNFPDATVKDGLLRVNVPNYWFIGEKGYETLAEAIEDAEVDDEIKGIPGVYEYDTIHIGHRTTPAEPWAINKQITVTSLTDEPITLKALGKNIFNLDYYSNITVKNIIFMNAYNPDGWGGAIHSMGKSTNIIENCTFMDNYAEDGAAIHAWGNLYIKDCLFINNEARVYAGAIFKDGDGDFVIENCKFINNTAFTYAGAVYTMGYSDTYQIFKNITFDGNDATCGGALFTAGKNVTFIDCNFTNNKAINKSSGYEPLGGAIYVHHGATKFINVNIINNTAEGNGGALELDNGALSVVDGSGRHIEIYWAILENCLIENNTASGFGGAFYTNELRTHVNITNSIIRNNTAKNAVVIVNIYGFYTLNNVTVEDNRNAVDDILTYSYGAFSIPEPFYSNITILNSTFRNNGNNIVAVAFSEYVTVNISDSTFDGNGPILESSNATAYLTNNVESNPLGNYSIDNNGNLTLMNNTFANPVYSTGYILSPTFLVVIGNETRYETVGNATIDAVVVDDNNNPIFGANLTFLANGNSIPAIFESNRFVANYTVGPSGQSINASYDDKGLLNLVIKPGEIIGRVIPQISADNVEFNITGEFKVSLTYDGVPIANEKIVLTVNNKDYSIKTDSNGIATFNLELTYGNHVAEFEFNGNNMYAPVSGNATITVNKFSSKIDLIVNDIEIYEDAVIEIYLPKGATGNVIVDVNGRIYSPEVNNSAAIITIPNLGWGSYDVFVEYHGDERFLNSSATGQFKVTKKETTYDVVNDGDKINIILPSDAGGNVTVKVSGKTYTYALEDGKFSLNIDLLPKEGNIEISYSGDGRYAPFNITRSVSSLKSDTVINAVSKFSRNAVDYSAGERGGWFYVTLKDSNGNPLAKKTIQFVLNGKTYNSVTDSQGRAGIQINFNIAGVYTYKISFAGDGKYNPAQIVSSKLTVNAKKITIKAKSKKFKAKTKVKKYTITLKTTKNQYNGKTYLKKGKKVTLKVKGKTYTAKTNAKGKATFKIKKLTKKGKYTAVIKFKGDKTYKSATKKVKITVK